MPTTLHPATSRRTAPATVVVPRQTHARAALTAAEQVTALRRLKRSLVLGMSLADVHNTIDDHIADIEAEMARKAA